MRNYPALINCSLELNQTSINDRLLSGSSGSLCCCVWRGFDAALGEDVAPTVGVPLLGICS